MVYWRKGVLNEITGTIGFTCRGRRKSGHIFVLSSTLVNVEGTESRRVQNGRSYCSLLATLHRYLFNLTSFVGVQNVPQTKTVMREEPMVRVFHSTCLDKDDLILFFSHAFYQTLSPNHKHIGHLVHCFNWRAGNTIWKRTKNINRVKLFSVAPFDTVFLCIVSCSLSVVYRRKGGM